MIERLHYYAMTRQVRVERDAMIDTLASVTHAAICGPRRLTTGGRHVRPRLARRAP